MHNFIDFAVGGKLLVWNSLFVAQEVDGAELQPLCLNPKPE